MVFFLPLKKPSIASRRGKNPPSPVLIFPMSDGPHDNPVVYLIRRPRGERIIVVQILFIGFRIDIILVYATILHADFQQAVLFERDGVRFADRLPVLLVGQHEVCLTAFRADILIRINIDSVAVAHIVVSRIVRQLVGIGQQVRGEEPALARSGGVCLSRMADLVVFRIAARHDGSRDPLDTYPVVLFRVFTSMSIDGLRSVSYR